MPFRPDRQRRAGPWLEWKVATFSVGAVLALAGFYTGHDGLVTAAIVVLAAGVLLRMLSSRRRLEDSVAPDDADEESQFEGDSPGR